MPGTVGKTRIDLQHSIIGWNSRVAPGPGPELNCSGRHWFVGANDRLQARLLKVRGSKGWRLMQPKERLGKGNHNHVRVLEFN